jgi:hypothetical protein
MNNVLLLTATIVPKSGTPNLSRADPRQRLSDYMQAMSFYLGEAAGTFDHIVFCENSKADLSELRALVGAQGWAPAVTFYSNDGDYPAHYDRGYGEFKLIDEAMATVEALQGGSKVIWKITGRYVVSNIAKLVRQTKLPFDLACNYRNHPKSWVDTYLMAWTPDGYERHLRGAFEHLKANVPGHVPGTAAEEMLRPTWTARRARSSQGDFHQRPTSAASGPLTIATTMPVGT